MESSTPPVTEKTTGVRAIFSLAWAYRLAQWGIGADRFRDTFVDEVLRPGPNDRVIDIGCGTADILEHLPELDYVGFDHSQRYIDSARARHPDRGRFHWVDAGRFQPATRDRTLAMAIGVLHHLDDDTATDVFSLAGASLVPGGRFVSIDPTLVDGQHPLARLLASQDRGQNVRTPDQMRALIEPHFDEVSVTVRHDLLRVPYSHVITEARVTG